MENGPFEDFLLNMGIFHCYVSLLEGMLGMEERFLNTRHDLKTEW